MKKVLLLLLLPILAFADPLLDNIYPVEVTRIIDGDTFEADVKVGFTVTVSVTIRVMDIDTPETWRPKTKSEKAHGEMCTEKATQLLERTPIHITQASSAVYNRIQAYVILADGRRLSDVLIAEDCEKWEHYEDAET